MVEIQNGEFLDLREEPVRDTDGSVMSVAELIRVFVFAIPREQLTMQDCAFGTSIYQRVQAANGSSIRLEDAEYKWLLEQVRQHAPRFLGMSAAKFEKVLKGPA